MMKAFSFQSILKNFSKITSLLAAKRDSGDLRVDYGVSRPFSHCASRRASHFAAILLFLMVSVSPVSAQYDLFGYGRNATGGGNATPILVDTEQELLDALSGTKSDRVVIITANITVSTQFTAKGSNITLLALPGRCLISNGQSSEQSGILNMRGSNIIIRNVTFIGPGAYDCNGKDLLQFEDATNAWVDHCDFQDGCDGNFDIKSNSDNITVTWCRFRYLKPAKAGGSGGSADHRFTNLLGSSSSAKPADGTYNVSYAYNWWDNGCKERMVRCRNCEIHFFNCYWNSDVANYYVGPENATCYFEGCTFAGNANKADKIFKSYGGTNACRFVNSVGNLPSNQGTVNTPSYSYSVASASDAVASITDPNCGAGATLVVDTDGSITTCGANLTKYTVTFNLNGKGTNFTQEVYENRTIAAPATPTTSGFVFDGWYTNQSCTNAFDFSTPITANRTLYAKWVQAMTVTFNLNGKGTNFTQEVVSGGKASVPSNPTAAGYIFAGWYTDQACTTEYDFNTTITAAKTIYAKWEETNYCYEFTPATSGDALVVGSVIDGNANSGGTMTVSSLKEAGSISYNNNGLKFSSGSADIVTVTLDNYLQAGSIISLTLVSAGSTNERGLDILDANGKDVSELVWEVSASGEERTLSYEVTNDDNLVGTKVFQLQRHNSIYLKNITVGNCGDGEPDPTPDPEPEPEPDPTPGGGGGSSIHYPGVYETTYGQTLTTFDGRKYEIYGFSSGSSQNFIWAGTTTVDASSSNCILSFATTEVQTKEWVSNNVNGRGSSFSNKTQEEFSLNGYSMNYRTGHALTIRVCGFDQFSIYAKDNNATSSNNKHFVVTIDGVDVTKDLSTNETIRRYDLTTTEHTIVVSGLGGSNNVLNGFSLRVAETTPSASQTAITLSPQGGTGGTTEVTATKGEAMPAITIPTRTGYNFQGYFTANGGTGTKYYNADGTSAKNWDKEDAPVTLIAYWTAKTTNVTLNANGGSGGDASVTATYGSAMPTITPATKVGYTLTGYFDAASGGVKYYNANGTSAKNWDKTSATTLYAQWECTAPTNVVISGEYIRFPGETLTLTVSGENITGDATYTWKKGDQVLAGQTIATLTINNATITDAGNYTCTVSNGTGCEATANYTVKMYSLRGLIDWSTDCAFTKVNATTATYSMELAGSSSYEFKIFDGNVYYGNEGDNPTMTSSNCTNWPMKENIGNNVTLQTTAAGTYTFILDYTDASNPTISVTYPQKKMVYLNPGEWNCAKYAVYSWDGEGNSTVLMTKIDDCADRNIYYAEINAAHSNVIFIGGTASYDIANTWNNVSHKTIDLTYPSDDNILFDLTQPNTTHLFLTPNNNWKTDGARFAAYFFNNGETWSSLSYNDKESVYYCKKISGYPSVIFCRMNPSAAANNWDNKWNQSSDLTIPTNGTNHYTVKASTWDKGGGTWSTVNGEWTTLTPNYTVTFDTNGHGTAPEAQCVAKNGRATQPTPAPTTTGYTFGGWYKEAGCTNAWDFANGVVTSDITLYAKWTVNTYQITYKEEDRTTTIEGLEPTTYTYGVGVAELPTPSEKIGYTFDSWYSEYCIFEDEEGVNNPGHGWVDDCKRTSIATTDYGNVTFLAKYIPNTYTVTLNTNEGTINAGEINSYTFGVGATLPIDVTKENYTFLGWFDNEGLTGTAVTTIPTNATGDKTYWAKWENNVVTPDPILYTVTFNANGGQEVSPITQTSEGAAITLPTPTRDSYEFNGWYIHGTIYDAGDTYTPTANTTAYAIWQAECTASGSGGGGGNVVLFDVDFTKQTLEDITTANSSATFVAKTYNGYKMSMGVKYGKPIKIISTGLEFSSNNYNAYTCLAIPLTLTKDNEVTVVIELASAGKIKYGWTTGELPATPSAPDGTNYSTAATTNTLTYTPTTAGTHVLYLGRSGSSSGKVVKSIKITQTSSSSGSGSGSGECYYVTYNGNGAESGFVSDPTAYHSGNTTVTVKENGFTKTGYTFNGWNTAANGSGTSYAAGATFNISANTTLYAQWTENAVTPDPGTQYAVTHTLSNVTATSGATGAEAATEGAAYAATFEAATGFILPNTITVTIGGATQAAGTGYTWNPETGVLNISADKVKGDIVITIAGQVKAPELICEELFYVKTKTTSQFDNPRTGTVVSSNLSSGANITGVDGFNYSVKPNDSNPLVISPKDGETFQAGDKITVWVYNSGEKTMGFKLKSSITAKVPAKTLYAVEATLVAGDITTTDGKTTIVIGRTSADDRWVAVQVERCVEESCTEPSTILAITADPVTVQASQPAAISVTGGNEGPIAFTVTPATGAVTGNEGAYSFSATEVGEYVIKATQADFNGVCGGNATCVISVTAIGSLTAPTITATDLNENTADAFTFCETDNDDALKVVATSTEEGVTYAYQWYVKETDSNVFTAITGATEAIYPPTMDGIYYCEVTAKKPGYTSASDNSKEWTITITQSTAIISQPTSVALDAGQATLEVEAEGENLQYQWYSCEDDNRTNPETITGAINSTYTATAEGYYYVVVSSDCGVDRTSDVVQVTKEVEYCFNMTDLIKAKKTTIDSQSELTSTHATITGGTVLYDRVAGETMELSENGLKFNSNSDYLKVTLKESALTNGTVIEFTYYVGSTGRGIKILKSDKTTEICSNAKTGTSGTATYSFTITEEMQEEVFYITRVGGTAYLQSLRVSDCGAVCSDNTPTLSASTTNISASTSVTLTASNYTDGATLSFYKEGVAEPLQTGIGNTCTVTVDVTSTFYVVAVKDCERRSSSVTVTFTCATPQPKIIQVGGVLGCNETVTLKAVTQEGTDITEGTLQWYKNGVAIAEANADTLELNLEDVGEYTVSLTNGCMAMSTNTAVVSNEVPEPELEVLAPRQYYQLNHDYTEEQKLRYLMKLTLPEGTDVAGATDGAYQITATLEENTLDATQFVENKIEEGVYWIMLNLNSLTANADTYGLAAGDIISIKVTPLNLCGEYPAELARTVEVKVTDKPTLAFIVSGADGNGTKEKKSHKVNGDFLTGYNKADLCLQTGTTSFDNTQELPLYTYLKEYFEVVPVNGYAPYNYYNYDPFDIALLTDFPKTKAGVGNDTLISAANLNALADLVDRKPLLSLKTHMVNTALGAWSEKGFIENPLTTKNQVNMTLLCHAHEMFKEDISIAPDDEGNVQVDILTQVGFDANKGMQGFRALASTNFINIATTVNSADNTNLVACCERQANVEARMLLLSINADATSFISDNGKIVIRNALHYLLQTDPTHVSDCSIVFDNGGGVGRTVTLKGKTYTSGDNEWGNPANWSTSTLPNQANNVLIEANCQVTNVHSQTGVGVYGVANVRINQNYKLTIAPTGGIVSTGLFAVYEEGQKYEAKQIRDPKYITVQANETNTGLLMHSHQETLHATVQMYSPANHDKEGGYNTAGFHKVKNYTDVAVPVEVDATFFQNNGHEAQYWKWNEKGTVGFERQTTGTVPHFQGGCISHCDPQLFSFAGQVALAKDHPFEMTYSEGGWYGINVVGNSWTAPIQILELTAADFGSNLEQTIYIYNTGHDATAGTGVASQADFSTPGQWMAIPIEAAKTGEWAGPKVIPAMQAFQVLTLYPLVTPADGETQAESQTLTIGYNKHIRCRGAVNGLTQKLYAPQRPKKAPRTGLPSTAEVLMPDPNKVDTFVTPTMLRVMFVADSVKTDVYLFEDDQRFKNGFDNGWDGLYQNDETVSGAYVLTEAGNMAISAQPYLEGTTVALKSKKTTTFQCTFKYTGTETLYLNDTKLEQSTKIEEGASYVFMASPEDAPNRFVISAEPYQGSITGMAGVVMVDNALVVNNPLQEPLRVFIYDAVGRTHHVYDTKAAMEEIILPNVPGVYLIRVKGENTDLVHKVVR